jgi:hypothetical protein
MFISQMARHMYKVDHSRCDNWLVDDKLAPVGRIPFKLSFDDNFKLYVIYLLGFPPKLISSEFRSEFRSKLIWTFDEIKGRIYSTVEIGIALIPKRRCLYLIFCRNIANQLTIQAKYSTFYSIAMVSNFLPKLFRRHFYRNFNRNDRNSDFDFGRRNRNSEKQLCLC